MLRKHFYSHENHISYIDPSILLATLRLLSEEDSYGGMSMIS
jgi:hypothetical protein